MRLCQLPTQPFFFPVGTNYSVTDDLSSDLPEAANADVLSIATATCNGRAVINLPRRATLLFL